MGEVHVVEPNVADSAGNPYRLLHAVTLTGKAHAIGKSIEACSLKDVEIREIKRHGQGEENPSPATLLQEDDTLILYGPLEAVEAAESKLLGG